MKDDLIFEWGSLDNATYWTLVVSARRDDPVAKPGTVFFMRGSVDRRAGGLYDGSIHVPPCLRQGRRTR
jgi:hypothetical protein